MSKFLRNEDLFQYFPWHLLLGQVIFEYILYPIYFLLLPISFIYLKSFFITITIKWCFVDIVDDEGYFQFPPEDEFTSRLYINITFATDTEAESSCFAAVLKYYDTFKVRKFGSLFYKTNTLLRKAITCIGLQAEQIFSLNI